MAPPYIPPITPEVWIENLLEAVGMIADREHQESRWLAEDALAWEKPEELINVIDDCVFDGFLEKYDPSFSEDQRTAAAAFRDYLSYYCDSTPGGLDPVQVLKDPKWAELRERAAAFVLAFRDKWPVPDIAVNSN